MTCRSLVLRRALAAKFLLVAFFGWALGAAAQGVQAVTETSGFTTFHEGKVGGPATAIVEATLKRAKLDYRVSAYPWARAYDMALHEPNVLIYLIARTPEREALFNWVGEVVKVDTYLYKLRSRMDITVASLDDAKRYRVGVIRDDVRQDYLRQASLPRLVVSAQNLENFRKLLNGQVDLVPLPERDAVALCREARFDCKGIEKALTLDALGMDLYLAYSKATPANVVERTRKAFHVLKADGVVARILTAD